jgi:hypothetical protein
MIVLLLAMFISQMACGQSNEISGTVSGDKTANVTITLSGDASSTIKTDGVGTYRFTGLAKGDYTDTPTLTDSTFSPSRKSVTIAGDNITGVDFRCICDDEDNDDICD